MTKDTAQNGKSTKPAAVVVGVDGSPGAKAALRWTLAEALSASNASITRSVRSSSSTRPSQRRLAASRLSARKLPRRPDSAT
jgi:hypothetical protein